MGEKIFENDQLSCTVYVGLRLLSTKFKEFFIARGFLSYSQVCACVDGCPVNLSVVS